MAMVAMVEMVFSGLQALEHITAVAVAAELL
jgi:hypothetical protein